MNRYAPRGLFQTFSYAFSFSFLRWRHLVISLLDRQHALSYKKSRELAATDCFNTKYAEFERLPWYKRANSMFLRSLPGSGGRAPNYTLNYKRLKRSVFSIDNADAHDLSRYRIHSDQQFGGSSWAELKMGETQKIVETQPGSGEFTVKKVKTLIFYGELKPVKPWTPQQQKQIDTGFLKRWGIQTAKNKPKPGEVTGSAAAAALSENDRLKLESGSSPSNFTSPNSVAQSNALIQSRFQFPGIPQRDRSQTQLATQPHYTPTQIELSIRKTGNIPPPPGHFHGFCSFFSPNYAWPDLDLSIYDYLKVNMRTDGRQYFFNIKSLPYLDNLYQVRVPAEKPRPLHTKEVRFSDFIEVFEGEMVRFPDYKLRTDQITCFGFSVSGPAGPFELELECIEAYRGTPDYEREKVDSAMTIDSQFEKNKDKNVYWWLSPEERKRFGLDLESRMDIEDPEQVRKRYRKWVEKQAQNQLEGKQKAINK